MSLSQRIGHWLEESSTNRYIVSTVAMAALVALFSCISYQAGVRAARDELSQQLEAASERNYRLLQQVDCDLSEALDTGAPDPLRKRLERCKR